MKTRVFHSAGRSAVLLSALIAVAAFANTPALAAQPQRVAAKISAATPAKKKATPAARSAWSAPRGVDALAADIGAALSSHTRSGQWGAIVVSLTRGDTLFAQSADAMMQPASTMKMYTAAAALDHFGPDYSFKTPALRDGPVGPDGVLQGNLYLRGVGDPSMSQRFWHDADPMTALAGEIAKTGIKRVKGDIVGDATAFDDQLVPDGWKTSYLGAAYAARVSALSLSENLVWVAVKPDGKTASVTLEPATTTIPVESSVRVGGGRGDRKSVV